MRYVEFDTVAGGQVTIFFTGNLTVQKYINNERHPAGKELDVEVVYVLDGLHNNGGWKVKGSYQEVVNKILLALE